MTQTLTTERLHEIASGDAFICTQDDESVAMARELLANREAQPVAAGKFAGWGLYHAERDEFGSWLKAEPQSDCSDAITKHGYVNVKLFTAPPAPAVPNEIPDAAYAVLSKACGDNACLFADELWNACRAAMLAAAPEGGNG